MHCWKERQAPRAQPGRTLLVPAEDGRDGGGKRGCPAGRSAGVTEAGWGLSMDAGRRPAAESRCPPPCQGMHLKNQPARQLSHSTFYLQRGFQGSACPEPRGPPALLGCGKSWPGAGAALRLQPQREAAAQGAPGPPLSPEKRLQEAAGRGKRPRRQARGGDPRAPHSAW